MTMDVGVLIKEKSEDFKLKLLAGKDGIGRNITVPSINRPGLALTGFLEHFPYERIQVIGIIEHIYLSRLDDSSQIEILTKIFSNEKAVACVLTRDLESTDAMLKVFSDLKVPLLKTSLRPSALIGDLSYYLDSKVAPSIKIHGVMANVYGIGILIVGKSAMGKSECALELVKRGHKFIADDIVNIKKLSLGQFLIGSSLEITKHLIEVRGIGIIDVKELFGIGNILSDSKIELVIKFEEWTPVKKYDRIGLDDYYAEYLGVKIPEITIPVAPGRNLAVLVETASLNQRLKNKGHFTAKALNATLRKELNNQISHE
ncbi:MAG: HPr(Ser) kinase/phosphatase [Endomicrobium sp.]|jgi:HPr kinase/phosphorylase|uniref:HPr(Ser) kinase/phosphatase n=1 Tax=Candidatus Endomicrobiellum cubanum TaxID=3242325 RepID=UPI00281CF354|nr:HPr(Ser) kinase/phosphatase [Endomicrobium sp.]